MNSVMKVKWYLVCFSATINLIAEYYAYGHEFRIEFIQFVRLREDPNINIMLSGHYFTRLSKEDRWNMCLAAKEHAALDGMEAKDASQSDHEFQHPSGQRNMQMHIYPFLNRDSYAFTEASIDYPDLSQRKYVVTMTCETIPVTYLRVGNSNDQIIVMMKENRYITEKRPVHVEKVQSSPIPCLEILVNDPQNANLGKSELAALIKKECEGVTRRSSYVSKLYDAARLNLCFAAKKHLQSVPVLWRDVKVDVEEAQIFEIVYSDGRREREVAILCPTVPKMYVYFRENNDIQVILVEGKDNLEPVRNI